MLVSNVTSGASDREVVDEVRAIMTSLGEVDSVAPESLDEFDGMVRNAAEGADLVVVAGGDGTTNCAINALHDRLDDLSFAIVPMGTGNDLARTIGLPLDPVEAAKFLVDGGEAEIDVGRATGPGIDRLFLNACMGGFPVEVDRAVGEDDKRRLGPVAFWVGGAKAALDLPRFEVEINGKAVPRCVAVGVGNGRTAGGGISVFPKADARDGRLECRALSVEGIVDGLRTVAKVRSGRIDQLPQTESLSGNRIEITSRPELEFNVDGDLVGLRTPARFSIEGRIRLRVTNP